MNGVAFDLSTPHGASTTALALMFEKPTLMSSAQCGIRPQRSMSRLRWWTFAS